MDKRGLKVSAVMSIPRLCFSDNIFCGYHVMQSYGIPMYHHTGVFWEQALTNVIKSRVEAGDDYVIVFDYDSMFSAKQLDELFQIIDKNGFDAVFPQQVRRGSETLMYTAMPGIPLDLGEQYSRVLTGHFGLTILRCSSLAKLPQPWFWSTPNRDTGLWQDGGGKIDADNWFWVELNRHGFNSYMCNHVRIGHMELMISWPKSEGGVIRQTLPEFYNSGIPNEALDRSGPALSCISSTEPPGVLQVA